jgi:polysaccharide biosynthesis transport protein
VNRPTTLAEYLAVLWRRKWIIIVPAAIAALVAFEVSKRQTVSYRAEATVLVNRTVGVVTGITGTQDPATYDPIRFLTTQAKIARSPELAARVVAAAGVPGVTPDALLGSSSVTPETDADLLDVSVSAPNPKDAVLLTNAYARTFTQYKTELDTARINDALRVLRARTQQIQNQGQIDAPAYQALFQYEGQLETIGRLIANNTSVLKGAQGAAEDGHHPRRNLILGVLLGALLGVTLAFLVEALDRRVRSEEEVEAALGLPLLGRVPRPPRRLRRKHALVMLTAPTSAHAETFRRLRTSLEFVNPERGARTIMFTSAVQREGKSTTVANLGIALARAGRRVALVDLDVRRPFLHSFFDVDADRGIADVVVNDEGLSSAMQLVALPASSSARAHSSNDRPPEAGSSNGRSNVQCALHLLPCGTIPPADAEFLESERLSAVLEELGEMFDVVLVDAPPLLAVGDALSLSTKVDAIVVVTQFGLQRPLLTELARELQNCRAARLGFILTGVEHGDGYGYRYGAYRSHVPPKTERSREPV